MVRRGSLGTMKEHMPLGMKVMSHSERSNSGTFETFSGQRINTDICEMRFSSYLHLLAERH